MCPGPPRQPAGLSGRWRPENLNCNPSRARKEACRARQPQEQVRLDGRHSGVILFLINFFHKLANPTWAPPIASPLSLSSLSSLLLFPRIARVAITAPPFATRRRRFPKGILLAWLTLWLGALKRGPLLVEAYLAAEPPLFEPPQPLVYLPLPEFGSGLGAAGSARSEPSSDAQAGSEPTLIAARCWSSSAEGANPLDDECKQVNVITASNQASPQDSSGAQDDPRRVPDGLIVPVLIYESSSTLDPASSDESPAPVPAFPPPLSAFPEPPYFSRRPAYATSTGAPPAGLTDTGLEGSREPVRASSTPVPPSRTLTAPPLVSSWPAGLPNRGPLFVATPRPASAESGEGASTSSRPCRDENDADCDEPEELEEPKGGQAGGVGSGSGARRNQDSPEGSGSGPTYSSTDDDDEGGADEDSDSSSPPDDDSNGLPMESSGAGSSEPEFFSPFPAGKFAQVTNEPETEPQPDQSVVSVANREPESSTQSSSARPQKAEIEVVVHPTLPPIFQASSSPQPAQPPETQLSSSGPTTTPMPDDTFKSKPIFPQSPAEPDVSSAPNVGPQLDLSADSDLATFRPVPVPTEEPGHRLRPADPLGLRPATPTSASGPDTGSPAADESGSEPEKLADRFKFDSRTLGPPSPDSGGSPAPSTRLESPWREKPWRSSQAAQGSALQYQPDRQQRVRPSESAGSPEYHHQPNGVLPVPVGAPQETLTSLLLYSSIIILIVTASIFVLMALLMWRRNSNRQRALLMAKNGLLNGAATAGFIEWPPAGAPAHMATSSNQGNHLLANTVHQQQQPGLLTTYAPMVAAKFGPRESAKGRPEQVDEELEEVDEQENSCAGEEADEQASLLQMASRQAGEPPNGKAGQINRLNQTSSWSTEDNQTGSSGSHKMDPSGCQQQPIMTNQRTQIHRADQQRHHSSSISDSQASPDNQSPSAPPMQTGQQRQQVQRDLMQPSQQVPYQTAPLQTMQPMQPAYQMLPQVDEPLQHQARPAAAPQHPMNLQRMGHVAPVIPPKPQLRFSYSRSFDQMEPVDGGFVNQARYPLGQANLVHYNPAQSASYQPASFQRPMASMGYPLIGHQLPSVAPPLQTSSTAAHLLDYPLSNGSTNAARLATNPLATLSRRYQTALNRNILSEDSSSLITASPSLARTSSSSSFAFNGSQHQLPASFALRARPLIDASSCLVNDYSQSNFPGNTIIPAPTPTSKTRSDAWFV